MGTVGCCSNRFFCSSIPGALLERSASAARLYTVASSQKSSSITLFQITLLNCNVCDVELDLIKENLVELRQCLVSLITLWGWEQIGIIPCQQRRKILLVLGQLIINYMYIIYI